MPHVFPSGQFPPGACGQVRPVGANLPTAARRAPPAREAADGSPAGKHVIPGPQEPECPGRHFMDTYKHEKESPDDLSSEDSFKARRLPTLPPGLAVPSAMTGLASLFGMGRGGSPSL